MKTVTLVSFLLFGTAYAQDFPSETWDKNIVDGKAIQRLRDFAFPTRVDDGSREGLRTNALVVVKDGKIVFEEFHTGFTGHSVHVTWSMTKSFTNALVGIAQFKAYLSTEDKVSKYVMLPEESDARELTIEHLLHWESGLQWSETYEYNPLGSSVLKMLFSPASFDMARFVISRGFEHAPGSHFRYSSGDSVFLMKALKGALPADEYPDFAWKYLFNPLGMKSVVWETDDKGLFVASSYLYASAYDLARFGWLVANNGAWKGEQIFSRDWIEDSTKITETYAGQEIEARPGSASPGAHWWVNRRSKGLVHPDMPKDALMALGHWGQLLIVFPSQNIVIVRLADDRKTEIDRNELARRVLGAFGDQR